MDKSRFPPSPACSSREIDQLRKFLQAASQIPSTNSVQEALQRKVPQSQPSFQYKGGNRNKVGASKNILNAGSRIGSCQHSAPVTQPTHVVGDNDAGSSNPLVLPVPDGYNGVKYPEPNVKSMLFDIGTGYLFDKSTGLYFDANADLFINKQLNVLLKWNPVMGTYSLVGRASDIAAPALAQDLARLVGHGQIPLPSPSLATVSVPLPPVPSSSKEPVGDTPLIQRERSWDFEEMASGQMIGVERSPDHRERRRSLSFEEMTPERDVDELPSVSVFPRESRSPSYGRSPWRDASQSPRRGDPDERNSPDTKSCRKRDSSGRRSPVRERVSQRNYSYSRSPSRDYSGSPSPGPSRRRSSPLDRSKRRLSPRRVSRPSPSPLHSRNRRISTEYDRGRSPPRGEWRGSRDTRIRISPESNRDTVGRRRDSCGRRFHRNPSPPHHFGTRQKNYYIERDQTPRGSRRSRSRSSSEESRNKPRRSTSQSRTNVDHQSKNRRHSRRSRSPIGRKKVPRAESVEDKSDDSDAEPPPSRVKNTASTEGPSVVGETAQAAAVVGNETCFSRRFMTDNINRIYKTNLKNRGNIYGRLLPPHRVQTNILMLTPLPHKGDREWGDLEILLQRMLDAEGMSYSAVTVYPGDGGAPCNYCLIRFKNAVEAFRWYLVHEGTIDLSSPDGSTCTVFMDFLHNNWKCKQCKARNFSLRHFCYKCFWCVTACKKQPIQVSQLVTEYVGIAGLDCRFLSIEEVLVGLPPLDSFDIETVELLTEPTGIPVGLCVFKFKEQQESAAFYRFLQESCLNPIFVNIVHRAGLGINPVLGHLVKGISTTSASSNPPVPIEDTAIVEAPKTDPIVFVSPSETDNEKNILLWWRFVEGYDPEEGGDIMKYLFEKHPDVCILFQSAPAQILVGPLPIPFACDLMEYRDLLSRFLQSTGVTVKFSERSSICKAHHFGAPYNYALVRFEAKCQAKAWFERNEGKLVLHLDNSSTRVVHLHYSKNNWQCQSCHKLNFPIRIQCFSCYKSRLTNHTPVTFQKNPTIFIGITGYRKWCATEELLFERLPFLRKIQNLTVTHLKEPTGVPLGICVLKSATPAASAVLFNKLQDALTNEIARANIQEPNRPLLVYIA